VDINKLDLLSKGWNTSEITKASDIIAEAEEKKHPKMKLFEKTLLISLVLLMLLNSFICAIVLVPFIYAIKTNFILILVAVIGLIFGTLFSIIINDVEKIKESHATNMLIAFVVSGIVNFYFIITFTKDFGSNSKIILSHNIYIIAIVYFMALIIPHLISHILKGRSIE